MGNVIALNTRQDMWHDKTQLDEIRRMVSATQLSEVEFKTFVSIGRATGLNPFMKELWAVKYSAKQPAQIFIGLNGYRLGATRHPDYEYHSANSIYSNDEFFMVEDGIKHKAKIIDRGNLIGAYCIVKRKNSTRYSYVVVTMKEYNQEQSLWKSKPETMIKKVAECQGLRQAFPEIFNGTYVDAEMPSSQQVSKEIEGNTKTEKLLNILKQRESIDAETGEVIEHETSMQRINQLMEEINLPTDRIEKAFAHYEISALHEMNESQQESFLNYLEKMKKKLGSE
jgi:phage recombination protein Bet